MYPVIMTVSTHKSMALGFFLQGHPRICVSSRERQHVPTLGAPLCAWAIQRAMANPILHGIARRQHQHRYSRTAGAELAAHGKAIFTGEHHIQEEQSVIIDGHLVERHCAIRRHIHGVRLLAQAFCQHPCGIRLILYE
jgi:hypothetical protein